MTSPNETSDFFSQPALKAFAKQLQNCRRSEEERCWLIPLKSSVTRKETFFPARLVWLQGTVQAIINPTCLILRDTSGLVKVTNCDRVPTGGVPISDWIAKGVYCSVVGELTTSGHGTTPVMQAAKITSLENNPNLQPFWTWEVQDLMNVLVDGAE